MSKTSINKNQWTSFLLTLIATLIGVFIAIWISNYQDKKKERRDAIKLLHTAKLILEDTHNYTEALRVTISEIEKDSINVQIEGIKAENSIPYPYLLETIISNDLVSKNLSKFTHSSIYTNLINAKKLADHEMVHCYENNLKKCR